MQLCTNFRAAALVAGGVFAGLSAGFPDVASADVLDVVVDPLDYVVEEEAGGRVGPTSRIFTRTGSLGSGAEGEQGRNSVFVLALPALPTGQAVETASLSFETGTLINGGDITYNADLYALNVFDAGPDGLTADELPADYYEGPLDPNATLIQDNLLTPDAGEGQFETNGLGDAALAMALSNFYASNPGYTGGSYLFLRFSPDADPGSVNAGYRPIPWENGAENPGGNEAVLSITTSVIPEPTALASLALAGGFLLRRRR